MYLEQSRRYMSMGAVFLEQGMYKECVTVAGMAAQAKLRALYIQVNGAYPPLPPSNELLLRNLQSHGELDWDTERFLNELFFVSAHYDGFFHNPPAEENVRRLMFKTEHMLRRL
ncbi:hypothetical protein [Paenibacillus doosanensis]|uniref:hypothetical protein n=1 Tax=Paenibacillus doosanensis TaxID=1229154 RepID=UPI0035C80F0A